MSGTPGSQENKCRGLMTEILSSLLPGAPPTMKPTLPSSPKREMQIQANFLSPLHIGEETTQDMGHSYATTAVRLDNDITMSSVGD